VTNFKSLTAFGVELQRMAKDLTVDEKSDITRAMGREARRLAEAEASRDLGGDRAFSGWRRGRPIPLATQLLDGRAGATVLAPTKRAAGPWTVANQGRNQGNASGFAGPGVNRVTGVTARTKSGRVRKVRAAKGRRWNGTTAGMDTADRAVKQMERKLPHVADKEVRRVMQKRFDVT
jgi:hypothetical protein